MSKSMAQAEKKEWGLYKKIMAVATLIIFSLFYLNFPRTIFFLWHERADETAKIVGIIVFGLSIVPLLIEPWLSRKFRNESLWFILWIACIAIGIFVAAGFNFNLP